MNIRETLNSRRKTYDDSALKRSRTIMFVLFGAALIMQIAAFIITVSIFWR